MSDMQSSHSRFAFIFAAGTLFSRILGFVRDFVLLITVPQASKDAFFTAFKLPNMLRDLFGEGASNAAFIPVMSDYAEKKSEKEYKELVSAAMSMMLIILALVTVLGVIFAPLMLNRINVLSHITGNELPTENVELMVILARLMFPYLFMIGMTVFCMAPLFVAKHYSTPSWSPALLNISIIACCLLLHDKFYDPAYAILIGVWCGGIAQMTVNYLALGKHTGIWFPNFKLTHPGIRTMLWLLLPVLFGQATGEVNKLVDTLFAVSLGKGTVTALYFANRLVQLPLSIFGIATAVAILPTVSRAASRGNYSEIRTTMMNGFRQCFFLAFPAMLGLIFLGRPIIRLLEYRYFEPEDANKTATALAFYAAGLISFAGVKIAVSGFYAIKNTKTPVIVASISMFLNIVLNVLFVRPMGYKGLALATTISFTLNFVALYALLCERFGKLWDNDFLYGLFRMGLAALVMISLAYGTYVKIQYVLPIDSISARIMQVVIPISVAIISYFGLCALLHIPEFHNFMASLRRRKT